MDKTAVIFVPIILRKKFTQFQAGPVLNIEPRTKSISPDKAVVEVSTLDVHVRVRLAVKAHQQNSLA
jgi:hypothetical protein